MLRDSLTDISIRSLKVDPKDRYEVFDVKVPGFGVRVFPSGIKSFVLLYRTNGRPRRLTLGRYPVLSLAEARKLAQAALNRVAHGIDPQHEKDAARRAGFEVAVESFLNLHCRRYNRPNTARETARILASTFVKRWGRRDLTDIRRVDVMTVLDNLVEHGKPIAANQSLAAIRKFFNWAVERGLIEVSPCMGIKAPAPKHSRDRVLSDDELAAIWRSAKVVGYPFGCIVQLLILTAQRRGEVTGMRWSDIDLGASSWSIPAARTKSNRAQTLPLSPATSALISSMPQFDDDRVFPAQGESAQTFSGFSKSKRRLDALAGVSDWTLHDLRRTAATGMAKLGVTPHVVERILNHTTGTLGGVAGVYNRFGYLPEMRDALGRWTVHVQSISAPIDSPSPDAHMSHSH